MLMRMPSPTPSPYPPLVKTAFAAVMSIGAAADAAGRAGGFDQQQ